MARDFLTAAQLAALRSRLAAVANEVTTPTLGPIAITDVTGLTGALAAKETTANRGIANGYASLDATGKVPAAQLPATSTGATSYATLAKYGTD